MGFISWFKSWSASDNGTILGGADLQKIQGDITTVVDGGITNTNVNASAAIVESKLAFAATGGHSHNGTNSTLVSGGNLLRADITGCLPKYVSVDTVNAESGAIELNNIVYTRNAISSTINLSTAGHWIGDVSGRDKSKTFYIYAYNDSGTTWNIKFWDSAPQFANCGTDTEGTLIFRQSASVWYRCIGTATTNATGSGELSSSSVVAYPVVTTLRIEVFTSSGTFTAPAGVTQVFISGCSTGGDGGIGSFSANGGGGSSGRTIIDYPYTVVPGNDYTVTVNNNGTSEFDTLVLQKGNTGASTGAVSAGGLDTPSATITYLGFLQGGGVSGGTGAESKGGPGAWGMFGVGGAKSAHASPGNNGGVYGGGGGGAGLTGSVGTNAGGVGAKGIIIVSW